MSKLLIDGDIVAHRTACAMEKTKYCVTYETPGEDGVLGFFDEAKEAKARLEDTPGRLVWSRKELRSAVGGTRDFALGLLPNAGDQHGHT